LIRKTPKWKDRLAAVFPLHHPKNLQSDGGGKVRAIFAALGALIMIPSAAVSLDVPGNNTTANVPSASNLVPRTNWHFSPETGTGDILNERQDAICLAIGCAAGGPAKAPPKADPATGPGATNAPAAPAK
jgi:hypothetical protein